MATVSGKYGKVMIGSSTVVEVMKWSFSRSVPDNPHGTSATNGYKKRTAGTKDGTGSMNGMQDPADAVETYFEEGSDVTLKLYYTSSKFYQVPAMITKLDIEDDIDDGAPVPWSADFGIQGAWTLPT